MPYLSSNSQVLFAKETTSGTAPARTAANYNNVFGVTDRDITLPDRQQQARQAPSFGFGRQYGNMIRGAHGYSGTIPFLPLSGDVFYWIFGKDTYTPESSAGANDGSHLLQPREHMGLPSVSLLTTLNRDNGGSSPQFQRVWPGTVCSNASITARLGDALMVEASVLSQTTEDYSNTTPTVPSVSTSSTNPVVDTSTPYQWFHVDGPGGDVNIGSVSIGRLEEFQFRYDNRLNVKHYFRTGDAGRDPTEFIQGMPQMQLQCRMVPNDFTGNTDALYELLMAGNPVNFSIKFARSSLDYIQLNVTDAYIQQAPHSLRSQGNEVVAQFQLLPRQVSMTVVDPNSQATDTSVQYDQGWQ